MFFISLGFFKINSQSYIQDIDKKLRSNENNEALSQIRDIFVDEITPSHELILLSQKILALNSTDNTIQLKSIAEEAIELFNNSKDLNKEAKARFALVIATNLRSKNQY